MLRGERPVKRWVPCGPSNQHPHGLDTGFEVFEVTSAIHRGAPQRERARPPDPRSRAIVAMMRDDEQSAPPPRPDPARCSITNPHSIRNRGPRRGVRVGIITLSWLLICRHRTAIRTWMARMRPRTGLHPRAPASPGPARRNRMVMELPSPTTTVGRLTLESPSRPLKRVTSSAGAVLPAPRDHLIIRLDKRVIMQKICPITILHNSQPISAPCT